MTKIIPNSIIEEIRAELEWLGSNMWISLHVESQMDGSCMAVIIEIMPDTSKLVQKQICRLIRNACERRIPYKKEDHSWMGILTVNGKVLENKGIMGGGVDFNDYEAN
jgi:hypothetical protein